MLLAQLFDAWLLCEEVSIAIYLWEMMVCWAAKTVRDEAATKAAASIDVRLSLNDS